VCSGFTTAVNIPDVVPAAAATDCCGSERSTTVRSSFIADFGGEGFFNSLFTGDLESDDFRSRFRCLFLSDDPTLSELVSEIALMSLSDDAREMLRA